jgi:drug/metabolite transporter (DMT)-like permease
VTAALALFGALSWGVGDFLGGLASRRIAVLTVLCISQAVGLVAVVTWVLLADEAFPGVTSLLPAVCAGVAVLIGLGAFYRGLAIGAMGVVAPITAAYPLIPLAVDGAQGIAPTPLQWIGAALVFAGIAMLSREPTPGGGRLAAGVVLAVGAAVAFGVYIVGIDLSADESVPWTVLAVRAASVALVLVAVAVTSTSLRAPRRLLPVLVAIGIFDTGANIAVTLATTQGAAGIVAVLSALYPVVTIALARVVLGERLSGSRRAGGLGALAGAALVASA